MNLLAKSLRRLGGKASGYRRRKRRKQSLALVGNSDLFDRAWYIQSYPDVRASGVDPLRHYFDSGWREGRDPGPDFCTTAYLKANSDVAALGINPLLHYIEHGKFEGRGAPHQGAPFRAAFSPEQRFGPAAPCARFERQPLEVSSWVRAGRIVGRATNAAVIDGLTVAKFDNGRQRKMFDRALQQLAWFSGRTRDAPGSKQLSAGTTASLRDAWEASGGILRTRWSSAERPLVVRAIQHLGEEPALVGEGCVRNSMDCVDLRPRNPFFPVLFLFAEAGGEIVGYSQLTFPALCRGGIYYSELIALAGQDEVLDLQAIDRQLAEGLFEVRTGAVQATVAGLSVALAHADGTQPLFQTEYRHWLSAVMHMPAIAACEPADPGEEYLAAAVELDSEIRPTATAILKLCGNMVPSLSALLMTRGCSGSEEVVGSLIAEAADRNLASLVHMPSGMSVADFGPDPSSLPAISSQKDKQRSSEDAPLLAIRLRDRRTVDEAELLVPDAARRAAEPPAITWILRPDEWSGAQLLQSLEALAQQKTHEAALLFVGDVSEPIIEQAERLFGCRLQRASTDDQIATLIETPFVGYVGPGIVLHDRRTASLVAEALENSNAVTATALLVTAEKRGKGSLVTADPDNVSADAALLPGATVPIARAQGEFWIAGTQTLRNGAEREGLHLCVTAVTVSRLTRTKSRPPFTFAPAYGTRFVRSQALVG